MEIRKVAIDQVEPWDKNPRNIKTKDFERLKKQILKLGVYKPLICCEQNGSLITLGGNMRLRALKERNQKEVEVSIVHPKDEAEMIEFSLSDNDRAGEYDEQALAELTYPHIDKIDLGQYKVDVGTPINLKEAIEAYGPEGVDWSKALGSLPDGDRQSFQHMTFILHDEQVGEVEEAVRIAKKLGNFMGQENKNQKQEKL